MRSAEVSLTCGLVEHCTVDVSMHLNIYGFVDKSSHIGMNVNDRSTLSYSHIRHAPSHHHSRIYMKWKFDAFQNQSPEAAAPNVRRALHYCIVSAVSGV